jgi:type II secretory pathway pseudopilin PulG
MQFTLQTLLLVFVVLASSLGTFGNAGGIFVFLFVLLVAAIIHWWTSCLAKLLALLVIPGIGILIALLLPAVSVPREAARRERCVGNLNQIAAALAAYRTEHGRYPPAFVADASGKPMHSWRVLILPYLDCNDLYGKYDFEQLWNSPKNKMLAQRIPDVFRCPSHWKEGTETETSYVAVTGRGTAWNENIVADTGAQSRPEELILLIEVEGSGICWMEPRDSTPEDNVAKNGVVSNTGLGSQHSRSNPPHPAGHVVCADGSVRFIPDGVLPAAALTVGAAGQVDWEKLDAPVRNPKRFARTMVETVVASSIWLLSVGLLLYRARRSRKTEPTTAENSVEQTTSG